MPLPSPSGRSDRTPVSLLDRIRQRSDERDWEHFVELYRGLIRLWLTRAGMDDNDLDDLSQEVLTALVQAVPTFQHSGRPGAFRSWLKTLVIHRVLNFCRGRHRHRRGRLEGRDGGELDEFTMEDRLLTDTWEREHDEHVLSQLIDLVRDDFTQSTWSAFQGHVVDGKSAQEVATQLGLTTNAVLIAKSRVLKRLRQEAAGLVD